MTMGRFQYFNILSLLAVLFMSSCYCDQKVDTDTYLSGIAADLWLEGADIIRIIWRDCSKKLVDVKDVIDHKEYFPKFVRCMKRKTLRALDRSLTPDVVPIADGVNLVRFELVDKSGNVMPENDTSTWTEKELEEGDWRSLALQRMAKVLRTHVIKFDFEDGKTIEKATVPFTPEHSDAYTLLLGVRISDTAVVPTWMVPCTRNLPPIEFRGRRRHHMMTMMMFGVVSIGMVVIPMGFQFLAVLGGKALLLAKMALILASIQGLKKIAASPVNYGFYHSYPYDYYERRSRENWPPPGTLPAAPPPSMPADSPWIDRAMFKNDRVQVVQDKEDSTWKPELPKPVKKESEPRFYPVYNGPSAAAFTSIDAPSPLVDLTTRPGDVQADYSLDLPFNGLHFQSPTTVIST